MGRIRGASRLHNVKTPEELAAKHEAEIRARADLGLLDVAIPFVASTLVHARVDGGEWLIDCECGAGNAVEPGWPEARCFACGAVHTVVAIPDEETRLNIEHVLSCRPLARNRWWRHGEDLVGLAIENAEHGVRF
ncbi:MAG: hypothetical protein Q8T13_04870 [Acidobacteriota bacterium]|nr:hypothetical protein [Acidobacteriota bacterium]